jgi:hypothetical protein
MGRVKEFYMNMAESQGVDFDDIIGHNLEESLMSEAQRAFSNNYDDLDKWKDFLPTVSQFDVVDNVGSVVLIDNKFHVVSVL